MFHINKIINQKNIKHITTLLPFGSDVVVLDKSEATFFCFFKYKSALYCSFDR